MDTADALRKLFVAASFDKIGLVGIHQAVKGLGEALKAANPQLTPEQISAYDAEFERALPGLSASILEAQIQAVSQILEKEDIDLLLRFSQTPDIGAFFAVLTKIQPTLMSTIQNVLKTDGVAAHTKSAQTAFSIF